jgi:uncharacterized damage-inducible protein DinB
MAMNQGLLAEFDMEMQKTRKTLERIPDEAFTFTPHQKSKSMAWLASHVATLPYWTVVTMKTDVLDFTAPSPEAAAMPKEATNNKELLQNFDQCSKAAREAIASATDQALMQNWTLKKGDQVLFTTPKAAVLRGFVMNHLIHHRGQLTMYMRLKDIPVPALFGPSADENPWA